MTIESEFNEVLEQFIILWRHMDQWEHTVRLICENMDAFTSQELARVQVFIQVTVQKMRRLSHKMELAKQFCEERLEQSQKERLERGEREILE